MTPRPPSRPPSRPEVAGPPTRVSPWPFVGMGGLACVLFLDLGLAGVVPWWAVALLVAVWLGLFVVACVWWTRRPRRLPWLAAAGLVVWVVTVVGVSVLAG